MKKILLPKMIFAGVLLAVGLPSAQADSKRKGDDRSSQRYDTKVSNDSDRNRNVRNERIAEAKRQQSHDSDHHHSYRNYGRGDYGYRYGPGYYSYGYPYYNRPRTTIAIGVSPVYSTYSTSYIERERPIYRGQVVSEQSNNSLEVSVQRKLTRLGYYSGGIDGDIGPASCRAILAYQRDNNLPETGRIDRDLVGSLGIE